MDNSNYKISVTGLGYVGLPVLIAFSKINEVVGFDINNQRINCLSKGIDKNNEVDTEDLINSNIRFTNSIEDVKLANFHIVAVPTPVTKNNDPDLSPLISASEKIASILKKGDIVVYYDGANDQWQGVANNRPNGTIIGTNKNLLFAKKIKNTISRLNSYKLLQQIRDFQKFETTNVNCNLPNLVELEKRSNRSFNVYKKNLLQAKK